MSDNIKEFDMSVLLNKDVRNLVSAYLRISDPKVAKNVLTLVMSMAPEVVPDDSDADNIPDYVKEYQED